MFGDRLGIPHNNVDWQLLIFRQFRLKIFHTRELFQNCTNRRPPKRHHLNHDLVHIVLRSILPAPNRFYMAIRDPLTVPFWDQDRPSSGIPAWKIRNFDLHCARVKSCCILSGWLDHPKSLKPMAFTRFIRTFLTSSADNRASSDVDGWPNMNRFLSRTGGQGYKFQNSHKVRIEGLLFLKC